MNKLIEQTGLTFDDVLIVPAHSDIPSRKTPSLVTGLATKPFELPVPIISSPMDTVTESELAEKMNACGGFGIIHRYMTIDNQVAQVAKVKKDGYYCGAAIGVKEDEKVRAKELFQAGAELFCIDVAHGHHDLVADMIYWLKENYHIPVMAGNVATFEGYSFLAHSGADIVRVGIGSGGACTTRGTTGIGVPQITAIMAAREGQELLRTVHPPAAIVADGGIRSPSDAAKALAAGADFVMMGGVFARCKEAPLLGEYRGMASAEAQEEAQKEIFIPEGESGYVPADTTVDEVMGEYIAALKSAFSYVGATNPGTFYEYSQLMPVSPSTLRESSTHAFS